MHPYEHGRFLEFRLFDDFLGTGGGTSCFGTLFSGVLVPELAKSTTGGGADSAPSFLRSGVSTTVWESKGKILLSIIKYRTNADEKHSFRTVIAIRLGRF